MHYPRLGAVSFVTFLLTAGTAIAHPLGNFTINHFVRVQADRGELRLSYVLDEAEIPTFTVLRSLDPNGRPGQSSLDAWARDESRRASDNLNVTVDGRRVVLESTGVGVSLRPGAGGLQTLYLRARYVGQIHPGAHRLTIRNATYAGRIGWHDVALGIEREPTDELRRYPPALLGSPRDRTARSATVDASGILRAAADPPSTAVAAPAPSLARNDGLSDALSRGAGSPLIVLAALLLAIGLGALHALEPGHGKTLLAVSLVGARATARQAVILATALTAAHTVGVLALGALVLIAARWIVPETIYPWLTLLSGAVVAWLGARALATVIARQRSVAHAHAHEHPNAHPHTHEHIHAHDDHHHDHAGLDDEAHARLHAIPGREALSFRGALLAAVSGNIAPCPAALVVLLAAVSLHRVAYGLLLIVAFSFGLALVLTSIGLAVVRGAGWLAANPRFERAARFGPLVTASVISLVGATLLAQAFAQQGVTAPQPLIVVLVVAAIAGFALAGPHSRGTRHRDHHLPQAAEART